MRIACFGEAFATRVQPDCRPCCFEVSLTRRALAFEAVRCLHFRGSHFDARRIRTFGGLFYI